MYHVAIPDDSLRLVLMSLFYITPTESSGMARCVCCVILIIISWILVSFAFLICTTTPSYRNSDAHRKVKTLLSSLDSKEFRSEEKTFWMNEFLEVWHHSMCHSFQSRLVVCQRTIAKIAASCFTVNMLNLTHWIFWKLTCYFAFSL